MSLARRTREIGAALGLAAAACVVARAEPPAASPAPAAAAETDESLTALDEVLRRRPHDVEFLQQRAALRLRRNEPGGALTDLNAAARLSPLATQVFTNRGVALVMLGRDDEALADFRHSVALHALGANRDKAGLADAYTGIGQVWHRKREHAKAFTAYDHAARVNPAEPNAYLGRGQAQAAMGRPDAALADYGEAIRLAPDSPRAYAYRALTYERAGRNDEALADYASALRSESGDGVTNRLRGGLLSRLGRHSESLPDFDAAVRLDPRSAAALKDRGGVYNRGGDFARGLADLDQAVRLDPGNAKCWQNRAASLNGLGRYGEAIIDCDRALGIDPKNAGALNNRGLAHSGQGEYELAVHDLTEAIRFDPSLSASYLNRAGANLQVGKLDAAAADFDELSRREPALASAYSGKIRGLLASRAQSARGFSVALPPTSADSTLARAAGDRKRSQGDWTGAAAEYTRAVELDPSRPESFALRGWSRLIGGESGGEADARTALDLAGWNDPSAPDLALLGVLASRRAGREGEAAAFLDEALAHLPAGDWPAPVFRYLKRTLPSAALLEAADTPARRTLAEAAVGLDLLRRGERTAALEHLHWVRDRGADRAIAKDLVAATLARLDAPGVAPARPR